MPTTTTKSHWLATSWYRATIRERGLLVGVDVLVRDADRLLGGRVDAVVREQELEHVVLHVRAGGPGDRSEDPDPLDLADQQVEDPSAIVDLPVSPSGEVM